VGGDAHNEFFHMMVVLCINVGANTVRPLFYGMVRNG